MSTDPLSEFPQVAQLPRESLEELLTDPNYFNAIFYALPQVVALLQAQADLGQANEALAQRNLALQEPLFRVRHETQAAFDAARALEARWAALEREQRELYQRFTQAFLLLRLRHATTALDEQSEALASAFIRDADAGGGVDAFVAAFRDSRAAYHKRVIWGERWAAGKVPWPED